MDAPRDQVLQSLRDAAGTQQDYVVHWQSAFGLIVIEVRGGAAFVNGQKVIPATGDVPRD